MRQTGACSFMWIGVSLGMMGYFWPRVSKYTHPSQHRAQAGTCTQVFTLIYIFSNVSTYVIRLHRTKAVSISVHLLLLERRPSTILVTPVVDYRGAFRLPLGDCFPVMTDIWSHNSSDVHSCQQSHRISRWCEDIKRTCCEFTWQQARPTRCRRRPQEAALRFCFRGRTWENYLQAAEDAL